MAGENTQKSNITRLFLNVLTYAKEKMSGKNSKKSKLEINQMQIFYNHSTKPITPRNYLCMLTKKKCSYDCKSNITKIPEFKFRPHIFTGNLN